MKLKGIRDTRIHVLRQQAQAARAIVELEAEKDFETARRYIKYLENLGYHGPTDSAHLIKRASMI